MKPPSLFHSQRMVINDSPRSAKGSNSNFHTQKRLDFNKTSFAAQLDLSEGECQCRTPNDRFLSSSMRLGF